MTNPLGHHRSTPTESINRTSGWQHPPLLRQGRCEPFCAPSRGCAVGEGHGVWRSPARGRRCPGCARNAPVSDCRVAPLRNESPCCRQITVRRPTVHHCHTGFSGAGRVVDVHRAGTPAGSSRESRYRRVVAVKSLAASSAPSANSAGVGRAVQKKRGSARWPLFSAPAQLGVPPSLYRA